MPNESPEPAAKSESQAKVFISYAREDMAFVDRLEAALAERGFEALIDRTEIHAFEDWWQRIEAIIARADTFVFVVSPNSVASDVCRKELDFARSLNKRLAPIVWRRVDDAAVPETLSKLNFIFFDDGQFEASAQKLVDGLSTDIGWIRKHTEFGEHARRWAAAGRPGPRGLLLRSPVLEEAEQWIAARPGNSPPPTDDVRAFIMESRRAATKRRNTLTASLSAGLMVALVLTGLAVWQWAEAVRAKQNILFEMRMQQMSRDTAANVNIQNSKLWNGSIVLMSAVRKGAELLIKPDAKNALEMTRIAQPVLKQMREIYPNNYGVLMATALNEEQIGDALRAQGDRPGALAAFQGALAPLQDMDAKDRDHPGVQLWKAHTLLKVAAVGGDVDAAWTESLDILKRLDAAGKLSAGDKELIARIEKALAERRKRPPAGPKR